MDILRLKIGVNQEGIKVDTALPTNYSINVLKMTFRNN